MSKDDHGPPEAEPPAEGITAPASGETVLVAAEERSPEEVARILEERARNLSRPPAVGETGDITTVLTFQLGGEHYAVDVAHVAGIYPLAGLTLVPCTPAFVAGVINLRGHILTVLDIHKLLGLEGVTVTPGTQIIAVQAAGMEVGFLADTADGVRVLRADQLDPALLTTARAAADYTRGVTPDRLVLLDLEALLGHEHVQVWEEVG